MLLKNNSVIMHLACNKRIVLGIPFYLCQSLFSVWKQDLYIRMSFCVSWYQIELPLVLVPSTRYPTYQNGVIL